MENKEMDKAVIANDITMLFDALITKGRIEEDYTVVPGFTVTLKVLDTGELLTAETLATTNYTFVPADIVQKGRIVSILSRATIAVNGISISQKSLKQEENEARVDVLYKKYMQLPTSLINKAYDKYLELQNKQSELYDKPQEAFIEDIKNF